MRKKELSLAELINLKYPTGEFKNLLYTEEELGFKRRFKGREVWYNNDNWLITKAKREELIIWNTSGFSSIPKKEINTLIYKD